MWDGTKRGHKYAVCRVSRIDANKKLRPGVVMVRYYEKSGSLCPKGRKPTNRVSKIIPPH